MKIKFTMAIPVLCLFLMSVTPFQADLTVASSNAQESKIEGVYDGNEGYGYNFITTHKDDGSEFTMTFQKINDAVLKEFDLDAELFVNQKFEVTYSVEALVTKDENGFDNEEEVYTITHLKAL
ncbi:hypothetical protein [Gelidibacter sp.]|uniref:hypothetical protein n=1 Tax=Gelidibacter sp. TaxID=2018083 RepID=UPI002BC9EBDA|nr:hypothetical protein [Gelidibacter sp.]HUH27623.1 hypothetical protein [Gelidibacter sp.]